MTFKESILKELISRGMSDSQAESVFELQVGTTPEMGGRWNDDCTGYPDIMISVLVKSSIRLGKKWLEENKPEAWFLPMFG